MKVMNGPYRSAEIKVIEPDSNPIGTLLSCLILVPFEEWKCDTVYREYKQFVCSIKFNGVYITIKNGTHNMLSINGVYCPARSFREGRTIKKILRRNKRAHKRVEKQKERDRNKRYDQQAINKERVDRINCEELARMVIGDGA